MLRFTATVLTAAVLAACAPMLQRGPDKSLEHPEILLALTDSMDLISFQATKPDRILSSVAVKGLRSGDSIIGIDYRVNKKMLYAVSRAGQVYTLDSASGNLTPVGSNPHIKLVGSKFGVNFNPAADKIRVVSDKGQNLRFHPDTGVLAGTDNTLRYAENDVQEADVSTVGATAYTYNAKNDQMTTNFVVDLRLGMLVRQGSQEGREPVVSPNTGWLNTIAPLGTGPLERAALDIASSNNKAFLAAQKKNDGTTRLYLVDLNQGKTTALGSIDGGRPILGLTVKPQ